MLPAGRQRRNSGIPTSAMRPVARRSLLCLLTLALLVRCPPLHCKKALPASPTTSLRVLRAPQLSADLVGAKKKKKKKKKKSKGVKSTANIAFQDHLDKIELQLGECRSADGAGKESKAACLLDSCAPIPARPAGVRGSAS